MVSGFQVLDFRQKIFTSESQKSKFKI